MEMYGCPIHIPYTERFRPTLELLAIAIHNTHICVCIYIMMSFRYDGDLLLEEVDANFVVWEIHGRHNYKYTATAKKVDILDSFSLKMEDFFYYPLTG